MEASSIKINAPAGANRQLELAYEELGARQYDGDHLWTTRAGASKQHIDRRVVAVLTGTVASADSL
jgi:hypothetical protein